MINQEQKDTLNEYAKIKAEIKLLETKCEELNPQVLEIIRGEEVEEIILGDVGKLTLGERRTWKYSLDVESAAKYLKEKQQEEQRKGVADYTVKHYVIFSQNKDE